MVRHADEICLEITSHCKEKVDLAQRDFCFSNNFIYLSISILFGCVHYDKCFHGTSGAGFGSIYVDGCICDLIGTGSGGVGLNYVS